MKPLLKFVMRNRSYISILIVGKLISTVHKIHLKMSSVKVEGESNNIDSLKVISYSAHTTQETKNGEMKKRSFPVWKMTAMWIKMQTTA